MFCHETYTVFKETTHEGIMGEYYVRKALLGRCVTTNFGGLWSRKIHNFISRDEISAMMGVSNMLYQPILLLEPFKKWQLDFDEL